MRLEPMKPMKPLFYALACLLVAAPAWSSAPKRGEPLPPFALDSSAGQKISDKDMQNADLGVLYFFSTQNCPVCLTGVEQLKRIAADHKNDALRIVAVGKQDLATLKKAVPVDGREFQLASADAALLTRYNAQHIMPTTYVTGPGGEILSVLQGGGASTQAVLNTLAEKQLQRKRPAAARQIYESAEKAGGGSMARAGQGYSLMKEGKLAEAEQVFAAMAKASDKETALRGKEGLAEVNLAKGQPGEALKLADAVLAVAPKRAAANLIRASALHRQGQAGQAEQALSVATANDAVADFTWQKSDAQLAQGNLLRKKSPKIALASFRTAARENPQSVEAVSNLGAMQQALGDPKAALETLMKAQKLDPGDKLLHSLMRQTQEAIAQKQDLEKQRYIDDTVKNLLGRFKEQQVKKAATPGDDWTSPPMSVSLLGFREEGPVDLAGRVGLAGVLEHELQGALMARGVQVVDRALIDKLLAELSLGSSELADPETQLKLGRVVAARLIAVGATLAGPAGQARMRLIDTETTGIAATPSEKLGSAPDPVALAGKLADAIVMSIKQNYPLKGRIVSVDAGKVVLNLGKKQGMAVGQTFNVLGKPEPVELNGKVLGYKETQTGKLKVTEVQDGFAYAQVLATPAALEKNQRVILSE